MELLKQLIRPDRRRIGTKVIRNVLFSGARLLLLAPLPLVVIPFFLKKLGASGYGTWAVFLAISGVTSLADLGLVTTLSKHVAEFYAVKDFRALNRLVNTGFVLYLTIAGVLACILWAASPWLIAGLFRSSSVSMQELRVLWRCLILLVIANILTLLFSSIVIGLQRLEFSTALTSWNLLSSAGLSILFLSWGWGLRGVLYAYVFAAWATLCSYIFVARELLPELKPDPSDCHWTTAKEILGFSVKTYVTQVAVVIHNQIEKIYLARFVGLVAVGWYDISSELALKLRGLPSFVLAPIMPAAAELDAQSDEGRLHELYYRAHKYLALIGVPFVLYIVFVSKRFVELWVGAALAVIAVPLSILLIINFANLVTGPGLLILVAKGKLKPGLYSAFVGIALNLSLSLFLIRAYGFQGAVIGTSLSLGIASAFFLYLFQRETNGSFSGVIRSTYLKPVTCSLAVLLFLWLFTRSGQSSWLALVIHAIGFGAAYLVLLLLLRFFDSFDLAIVERFFPVSRVARRIIPDA